MNYLFKLLSGKCDILEVFWGRIPWQTEYKNNATLFNYFIKFMSMIAGAFYSAWGLHAPAKRVSDPGIKSTGYHAMNL